jgi:hypothetical protein
MCARKKKTAARKTSKPSSLPDGIEIHFSEDLTAKQRELVEQSIATMVERTRAQAAAALARRAEAQELSDAIHAPVAKLIRADGRAAEALEKLSVQRDGTEDSLRPEGPPYAVRDRLIPLSPTVRSLEVRVPPYDFAWRWHFNGGDAPFNQVGDAGGRLGIDARSGSLVPGGADRVVNAHIGVGCIVRIDRPTIVELSATRSSRHSFVMGAPGLGASAFSEGGLETTFMRGSEVLMASTLPLWQRQLSSGEAREQTDFAVSVFPDGMGGQIGPGDYAYNVGIYAVADHASGIGGAGVQSIVQSTILDMRINRR